MLSPSKIPNYDALGNNSKAHSMTKAILEKCTMASPVTSLPSMEGPKTYLVLKHMIALDHPLPAPSSYQNMKANYNSKAHTPIFP